MNFSGKSFRCRCTGVVLLGGASVGRRGFVGVVCVEYRLVVVLKGLVDVVGLDVLLCVRCVVWLCIGEGPLAYLPLSSSEM